MHKRFQKQNNKETIVKRKLVNHIIGMVVIKICSTWALICLCSYLYLFVSFTEMTLE